MPEFALLIVELQHQFCTASECWEAVGLLLICRNYSTTKATSKMDQA